MSDEKLVESAEQLRQKKCLPCEGGVDPLTAAEAEKLMGSLNKWELSADGKSVSRARNCENFLGAIEAIKGIAEVAESQQHHPDLHLTGYRHLQIVLTTHAIGGLSENDFIVAAKIDQLLD